MKLTIMKQFSVIICFLMVLFYSCEHSPSDQSNGISEINELGNFEYIACDSNGTVVNHGNLYLISKGSEISGYWKFDGGRNGQLEGTRYNNEIVLNLMPGIIDANFILRGTLNGKIYSGTWYCIFIGRVFQEGIFIAIKT